MLTNFVLKFPKFLKNNGLNIRILDCPRNSRKSDQYRKGYCNNVLLLDLVQKEYHLHEKILNIFRRYINTHAKYVL